MERIWRVVLPALLLCVILTGCGGNTANGSGEQQRAPEQEEKKEYTPGERTDTEYSSEWAGLRYALSDNMVMATEEELNEMMDLGAEALLDGDSGSKLVDYAKLTTVYEMMAVDLTDQSNIIICAEKLALSGVTEKQYLEAVQTQMEDVYSGYTVTYGDITERELCGMTFSEMSYLVDYGGASLYQTYLVRKLDNRMYGIVLSYSEETRLEALLEGFSAY